VYNRVSRYFSSQQRQPFLRVHQWCSADCASVPRRSPSLFANLRIARAGSLARPVLVFALRIQRMRACSVALQKVIVQTARCSDAAGAISTGVAAFPGGCAREKHEQTPGGFFCRKNRPPRSPQNRPVSARTPAVFAHRAAAQRCPPRYPHLPRGARVTSHCLRSSSRRRSRMRRKSCRKFNRFSNGNVMTSSAPRSSARLFLRLLATTIRRSRKSAYRTRLKQCVIIPQKPQVRR